MTHNSEILREWIFAALCMAALGSTLVPILYSFSPWRSRVLGKLFMLQAVFFAVSLDFTVIFSFWTPANILVDFWVEFITFTGIAISTFALTIKIWLLNHYTYKKKVKKANEQQGL